MNGKTNDVYNVSPSGRKDSLILYPTHTHDPRAEQVALSVTIYSGMKKTLIAASIVFLVVPFAASAHRWHYSSKTSQYKYTATSTRSVRISSSPWVSVKPAPTSTQVVSTTPLTPITSSSPSPVCYNYGHQPITNGAYNASQVATDLAVLKASGVNCLRLAFYGYGGTVSNYSGNFLPEKLATIIKNWESSNNWHFNLILGGDYGSLSTANLAAYDASVIATAKWAQTNGIAQLSLGNEQESRLSGMSQSEWNEHLRTLATQVKAVYKGKVSYEIDPAYLKGWIDGGLGSIDLIGLNTYCCFTGYPVQAIKVFGKEHVYLSEFNDDRGVTNSKSETEWAAALQKELAAVKPLGVAIYYFTYRDGGDGVTPDRWALEASTGQRHELAKVLGIVQAP